MVRSRQSSIKALVASATPILETEWANIRALAAEGKLRDWIDDEKLAEALRLSINSSTKTYRYVLPTQVLAKLADPSLDSRCLQKQHGEKGKFDARTFAKKVTVKFDQENDNVLGGSEDPYVSNPLRVPEVCAAERDQQDDQAGWDHLCLVIEAVENRNDGAFTRVVLRQILTEIYRRLSLVRVSYGVPRRVSLGKTVEVIQIFLSEHSGGDRLLALSAALFTIVGRRFQLYEQVRRGKITAADQPSGMLADLECVTKEGRIILAVEVKDRQITISQLRAKIRSIREKQVSEIFFVAQGTVHSEQKELEALVDREFTSGQNVYVIDLVTLSTAVLSIVGEEGRRDFLMETANQLDTYKSEITHRRAWASILESI